MPPIALIYIFMTALFTSLIMVPFLHRWALDRNVVDEPTDRKVHLTAVPRIGGIAICMAFLFSLLVYIDLSQAVRGILAGMLIIFFTGLVDDLYELSPLRKFLGEICAVVTAMVIGHLYIRTIGDLFGTGEIILPFWLAVPFTLVAIVGVINAFNLIDGLDGLAGGVSMITLAAFGILAYHVGNIEVVKLCIALLGAVFGFLKYNFFPARMFMGDAGSLVVGFVISFLALALTQGNTGQIQPVVPLLVVGLPVADTVWVMARRIFGRHNPFVADRTHVHHKFLDLGFEHRYTVILIYGISLFWAVVAVLFHDKPPELLFAVYLLLSVVFYLAMRFLHSCRDRLNFPNKDSHKGIRDSESYRWMADRVAGVVPLLQGFILVYLVLATVASSMVGNSLLKLLLVFLISCIVLIIITRDCSNQFLLAMYYGAAMVITYIEAYFGNRDFFPTFPLRESGDLLLLGMGLVSWLRFTFRREGEFYLTSLDYLLLGLSIFLAVVAPQVTAIINLTGVLVRGIIFFVTLKVVTQEKGQARFSAFVMLSALLAMVVVGFIW